MKFTLRISTIPLRVSALFILLFIGPVATVDVYDVEKEINENDKRGGNLDKTSLHAVVIFLHFF